MNNEVWLTWNHHGTRQYRLCASVDEAQQYQAYLGTYTSWKEGATDFALEPLTPCLEHFTRLVHRHDLTYCMSDDHRVWQQGTASLNRIRAMAKALPPEDVARIWNTWVDNSGMIASEAPRWYWRE